MCECLQLTIQTNLAEQTIQSNALGQYNGKNYYSFTYDIYTFIVWFDSGSLRWTVSDILGNPVPTYFVMNPIGGVPKECPTGVLGTVNGTWIDAFAIPNLKTFSTVSCSNNCGNQDRTFKRYDSIKLPEIFQEQNRGLKDCCCKYKVLGDDSGDSFKNDKTSAWIKLSDPSDTATFVLKKDGVVTTYTPTSNVFINEDNARYTTIDWGVVLTSDGVGCYTFEIQYSISGITGTIIWGTYILEPYTIQNALHTARVRAIFNGYQEIEQIDFSGSQIESTFRFCGYIGNRQPNTEIDNIIYQNREMKRVIRENLNSYEIVTDPSDECITRPLIDLFLLSENQLFISDYNAHNHSYRYQDIAVIVEESPSVEYYDFSRKAKLSCKVADKFKSKRTYYNK